MTAIQNKIQTMKRFLCHLHSECNFKYGCYHVHSYVSKASESSIQNSPVVSPQTLSLLCLTTSDTCLLDHAIKDSSSRIAF